MSERIDNLSIGITASAAQAVKAIERVNAALGKTGAAGKGAAGGLKPTKDKMEDVASSSQKAGDKVEKAGDKIKKAGDKAKESAKTTNKLRDALSKIKVGSGLKDLGNFFKNQLFGGIQSAISAANTLFSSLKRIAFYRAIRSAIKFITKGLKEGIENLYQWSATADGTFKKSMDSLATSALYLKNSFAAMVSPLIEAVAPAIDFVVDKVVGFFNTVNQVFAALTGKSTYTVAKKVATVWKEIEDDSKKTSTNTKKAADNAKKYVNTILAFDEINKLNGVNEPTTSGSSSTPGSDKKGGGVDYSTMFETRKINSGIADFANKLKEAFNRGDWKGLGKLLGDKVNGLVNSVDWAGLGRKVGYYINGWFSTKYWTLKTINFTKIGQSIATFLNNVISQINFNTIGRYFVRKLTAIADMIIGFFKTFDFGQLASAMSDFVIGMLEELTDWLGETDWTDFGKTLADKLVDVIVGIKWGEIASAFFNALNGALMAGLHLLGGFFDELASRFKKELNWDSLTENVRRNILEIMGVLGGAALAVGAILAFSGHLGLGIAIMAAGAGVLAMKMAMNESVNEKINKNMNEIMNMIYTFALVVGVVLAFSGHIPLGLAIVAGSAGALLKNNVSQEQWGAIQEKIDKVLNDAHAALYADAAIFVIGAILAFSGIATPIGIAMMVPAAIGIAKNVGNEDWGSVGNKIKGVLSTIYGWITGANEYVFVIGAVLAMSGIATPLGIAIMAGNFVWGAVERLSGSQEIINEMSEWWGKVVKWWNSKDNALRVGFLIGQAVGIWWQENVVPWWDGLKNKALKVGLVIKYSAIIFWKEIVVPWADSLKNKALKIGLVIKDSATTFWKKVIIPWWDSLDNYNILKIGFYIIEPAITWWKENIVPWWDSLGDSKVLGIGLGFTKTVSELASELFDSIKRTWDAAAYSLTINILPRIQGFLNLGSSGKWLAEKLGFGEGMAGSLADFFLGNAKAEELSIDVSVNAKPGVGLTTNSSGEPILKKLPDSKVDALVSLVKYGWSTIVDWATLATGGNVQEGVELVKKGWTQIDKWAEAYKGGQLNQKIGLIKSGWSLISSWTSKYTGGIVKKAVSLKRDGWTWVDAWVETFSGGTVEQGISLFVDNWSGFLTGVSNTLHSWFPNLFAEGGVIENGKVSRFMDGGVINAYAGGTLQTHGSLFLAGEAGPEIVGHVGGRTEVLNKSQIAATMYEAVRSAMTGITIDANVYQGTNGEGGNEAMLELIMEGNSATQREIDILREQNNILRQLLEKPVTAEISTNGIVNALSRKNKRDGTTVVPVMY